MNLLNEIKAMELYLNSIQYYDITKKDIDTFKQKLEAFDKVYVEVSMIWIKDNINAKVFDDCNILNAITEGAFHFENTDLFVLQKNHHLVRVQDLYIKIFITRIFETCLDKYKDDISFDTCGGLRNITLVKAITCNTMILHTAGLDMLNIPSYYLLLQNPRPSKPVPQSKQENPKTLKNVNVCGHDGDCDDDCENCEDYGCGLNPGYEEDDEDEDSFIDDDDDDDDDSFEEEEIKFEQVGKHSVPIINFTNKNIIIDNKAFLPRIVLAVTFVTDNNELGMANLTISYIKHIKNGWHYIESSEGKFIGIIFEKDNKAYKA